MSGPKTGYRIEVTPHISGKVDIHVYQYEPEGVPGWFPTRGEANADAARRMRLLAQKLLTEADLLLRDPRGM